MIRIPPYKSFTGLGYFQLLTPSLTRNQTMICVFLFVFLINCHKSKSENIFHQWNIQPDSFNLSFLFPNSVQGSIGISVVQIQVLNLELVFLCRNKTEKKNYEEFMSIFMAFIFLFGTKLRTCFANKQINIKRVFHFHPRTVPVDWFLFHIQPISPKKHQTSVSQALRTVVLWTSRSEYRTKKWKSN